MQIQIALSLVGFSKRTAQGRHATLADNAKSRSPVALELEKLGFDGRILGVLYCLETTRKKQIIMKL